MTNPAAVVRPPAASQHPSRCLWFQTPHLRPSDESVLFWLSICAMLSDVVSWLPLSCGRPRSSDCSVVLPPAPSAVQTEMMPLMPASVWEGGRRRSREDLLWICKNPKSRNNRGALQASSSSKKETIE